MPSIRFAGGRQWLPEAKTVAGVNQVCLSQRGSGSKIVVARLLYAQPAIGSTGDDALSHSSSTP